MAEERSFNCTKPCQSLVNGETECLRKYCKYAHNMKVGGDFRYSFCKKGGTVEECWNNGGHGHDCDYFHPSEFHDDYLKRRGWHDLVGRKIKHVKNSDTSSLSSHSSKASAGPEESSVSRTSSVSSVSVDSSIHSSSASNVWSKKVELSTTSATSDVADICKKSPSTIIVKSPTSKPDVSTVFTFHFRSIEDLKENLATIAKLFAGGVAVDIKLVPKS